MSQTRGNGNRFFDFRSKKRESTGCALQGRGDGRRSRRMLVGNLEFGAGELRNRHQRSARASTGRAQTVYFINRPARVLQFDEKGVFRKEWQWRSSRWPAVERSSLEVGVSCGEEASRRFSGPAGG